MKSSIDRLLLGFGLLAGLMLGTGHAGGGIALMMAGAACAWLSRMPPRGRSRA